MDIRHNSISISYDRNFYNNKTMNYYCNECMLYHSLMPLYSISMLVNSFISNREVALPSEKKFTATELATFDGSNGRPAYTAVNGIIFDVSNSPSWGGGTHFGVYAGKDVSSAFKGCHNTDIVLSKLPKVGILEMK